MIAAGPPKAGLGPEPSFWRIPCMLSPITGRPTCAAAVADLAADEAKLLAGGQTLLPTMKQRLAAPASLVDLGRISELSGISREGDEIVIGAMTRHADVATSATCSSGDPGARRARRADRRPAGAQSRHHRRLDRQQRSGGRLSRRRFWRSARRSSPTNARSPPTLSSGACSRRRWRPAKSSPACASRSRKRRPMRSSPIPLRASRWSACSSPRRRAACASR